MEVKALPYVDIQHDAQAVFDDIEQGIVTSEDIWVSGYKAGSSSVHGKARITRGGGITSRDGVQLRRINKTHFTATIPALDLVDVPITFPRHIVHPPYRKTSSISAPLNINALALSPSGTHLALGGPDGFAAVVPTSQPRPDGVILQGHVGDVLAVKYFPSGQVVLTASSDLSIRIWSATDGSNPRTLKGHTRGITSLGIIGVGKQVLSGSSDGTVRLWDIGAGKEVRKWETGGRQGVKELVIVDGPSALSGLGHEGEERVILAASQTGLNIFPWSADGETRRLDWAVGSNLVSMAFSPTLQMLATGHTNGIITLRLLSRLDSPVLIRRNQSPVYSLHFDEGDLYLGTAAGLPCLLGVRLVDGEILVDVKEELAGWEAVGVEAWAGGKEGIWCAGGEGGIRGY